MKIKSRISWVILTIALLLISVFPASAEDTASAAPDLGRENSITVTLKSDISGRIVTSGEFTLYQVAEVKQENGDFKYEYTNGFENCGITLGDLNDGELPKALVKKISGTSWKNVQTVGKDGSVTFSGLKAGLYLIVNSKAAKGYYSVNPFVVSAPMQEDGKWIYAVDASPKMETARPHTTDDSDDPEEPTKPDKPTTPNTPDKPNSPTPEQPKESVSPERPSHSYATPDGPGGTFVLDAKAPKKPEEQQNRVAAATRLPQTGQLNWPIPVLAAAGLIMFSAGWILKRGKGRDEK